jgi:hypothetical protein
MCGFVIYPTLGLATDSAGLPHVKALPGERQVDLLINGCAIGC